MIQRELDKIERTPSWLAEKLNNSRTNGHKIIHEKKYNDIPFLIQVSIIMKHNFLQDLADITAKKMNRDSEQNE